MRAKDSRYRSAVGGNSGHSGPLWGIEEHVAKILALHGNSGGVDADAVVHIFPGRLPTTDGYAGPRRRRAVFFLLARAPLTFAQCKTQQPKKYGTKRGGTLTGKNDLISNYDTNKTHLDEAPFGRADDDNWPGSEPPPHDRKRYVSTFITSRRWSPAAVGKLSFPRFKVYYLPRRCVRFEPRPFGLCGHRLLHDARAYGRSE
ncbi:hypothetical protein THAOC_23712, partial [Thalassiosira oceanica]